MLTETWCNNTVENSLLNLTGYDLHSDLRQDRADTRQGVGGGLLVYVKTGITILAHDNTVTDSRFNQYSSFEVLGFETKWTIYLI